MKVEVEKINDNGALGLSFPPELLSTLDWKPGDDVKFTTCTDGSFTIRKVKYESIELDLDEEEFHKYLELAHERNQSFNAFVEEALESVLEKVYTNKEKKEE
tara:strand:+ start:127 stop:432 length:306 start_codon:yes stop_codon:yes gene_type:complete